MPSKPMTHSGELHGVDARTPDGYKKRILLRETAKFWIDQHKQKWRKTDGWPAGKFDWPLYQLKLSSVRPLSSNLDKPEKG